MDTYVSNVTDNIILFSSKLNIANASNDDNCHLYKKIMRN